VIVVSFTAFAVNFTVFCHTWLEKYSGTRVKISTQVKNVLLKEKNVV